MNRERIARLMRERDIRGVTRRKRRSLTRADTKAKPGPGPDRPRLPCRAPRHQAGRRHHMPAHRRRLALPRLPARPGHPRGRRLRHGRPPSRRTRHRRPRHDPRPGAFGARSCQTQRSRQRVHIGPIPRPDTNVGATTELRTHRITLRQCRRGELPGSAQGGDRNRTQSCPRIRRCLIHPSRVGLRRLWLPRIHADLPMVPGRCRGHSPIIRTLLPHSRVMSSTSDVRTATGPG